MKKSLLATFFFLISGMIISFTLSAQDKTVVSIKIEKDGKVVKDTTFNCEKSEDAEHILKLAEIFSEGGMQAYHFSDDEHMPHKMLVESKDGKTFKTIVYVNDDGKEGIKELKGDTLIWVSESDEDGKKVKVIEKHVKISGDEPEMKKVYVITSVGEEGEESFDILTDEDDVKVMKIKEDDGSIITIIESENNGKKEVKVKVIKEDDGEGDWTVESDDENEVVIIKKEKEVKSGESAPEKDNSNTKKQK